MKTPLNVNPFQPIKDFEQALCEYTGAKYAVTTNSCTMALLLAIRYHVPQYLISKFSAPNPPASIPKRTYVSVPQSIIHAGVKVEFRDEDWLGAYEIEPYNVWDCARLFTSGMYKPGRYQCVSFHATKILSDTQGGAILHDSDCADAWFRRARFDGRTECVPVAEDNFTMLGYHCYMSPDVATRLLHKLSVLPKHNYPLPNDNYPDLSKFEVFK